MSCGFKPNVRFTGVSHWLEFVKITKGENVPGFPVNTDDILAWSNTFRCLGGMHACVVCFVHGFVRVDTLSKALLAII